MSKRKTKYFDVYASRDSNDYYGTVYDGMCKSKEFLQLSIGARYFYIMCRVESRSSKGKACLYKHAQSENTTYTDNCFVFPKSHQEAYGLTHANCCKYLTELEKAGFISTIENNKHRRIVNVYAFSNQWKNTS